MKICLIINLILFTCMVNPIHAQTRGETEIESVRLGNQLWMIKNLDVSYFQNGDPIPQAKNAEEWTKMGYSEKPAWCYCNFDPAYGKVYGKLYNWYAVTDSRGLAPSGWRIPNDEDFKEMILYVIQDSLLSGIDPADYTDCCLNFNTGGFRAEKGWHYLPGWRYL
jgi:uncharacterized protein (TIGR02145 family)